MNFGRMLDSYSIELLGAATNQIQREVAKFVRISSTFVVRAIQLRLQQFSTEDCQPPPIPNAEDGESRLVAAQRMERFLKEIQNPDTRVSAATTPSLEEDDIQRGPMREDTDPGDSEAIIDLHDVFEDASSSNMDLAQVKQFLGTEPPMETLRKGLRNFVIPNPVREEIVKGLGHASAAPEHADKEPQAFPLMRTRTCGTYSKLLLMPLLHA
ncbi:hypothetical protein QBC35DRAFT_281333 [Podospora australis]|uniref:Uncharacterized protein n=1 Tax=Podospora australis TaxID=1536484 RepID=A0AAN7AF19_9PEZI|nr:hypothetical protein QBC35DRAFT_281333 [Podospora australis]